MLIYEEESKESLSKAEEILSYCKNNLYFKLLDCWANIRWKQKLKITWINPISVKFIRDNLPELSEVYDLIDKYENSIEEKSYKLPNDFKEKLIDPIKFIFEFKKFEENLKKTI